MIRLTRLATFGILLITLSFCEKQSESQLRVRITVENYSKSDIDSLRVIYKIWKDNDYHWDYHVFYDLGSGAISDMVEATNLNFEIGFKAYLFGDSIYERWICPYKAADPIFYAIPGGYYNFGIIECDTAKMTMVVGLTIYD